MIGYDFCEINVKRVRLIDKNLKSMILLICMKAIWIYLLIKSNDIQLVLGEDKVEDGKTRTLRSEERIESTEVELETIKNVMGV